MINVLQKLSLSLLLAMICLPAAVAKAADSVPERHDARQLWQAFLDDHGKAEQTLVGKTIEISGIVVETGMSIYFTPNVRLSDAADGEILVVCVLPRSDVGLLADFKKGEKLVMSGRVYRLSPSSGAVVIKESRRVGR